MGKMNCSPTDYEKIVQVIYQDLLKKENIFSEVRHNVTDIKGKSGDQPQLDIYISYMKAGIRHSVIIECKNWNRRVTSAEVKKLKATMEDINATNGIIVTSIGYQSGAEKFANSCGIQLKRVNSPNEIDWDGLIKFIIVNMSFLYKQVTFFTELDFECTENKKILTIMKNYSGGRDLTLKSDNKLYSLDFVLHEKQWEAYIDDTVFNCLSELEEVLKEIDVEDVFIKGKYREDADEVFLKIKKIKLHYKFNVDKNKFEIDFIKDKKAVLQDFNTREIENIF